MKNMNRKQKIAFLVSVGVPMALASSMSNAALDAAITTAITGIQTNGADMLTAFWPVYLAIVGGFVLVKLFKRGASKV